MRLMTFEPNSYLIWGLSIGQQGKISSGVFADIDKTTGTLCPKSAHTSKKNVSETACLFHYFNHPNLKNQNTFVHVRDFQDQ